jgi:hypothetical protein
MYATRGFKGHVYGPIQTKFGIQFHWEGLKKVPSFYHSRGRNPAVETHFWWLNPVLGPHLGTDSNQI